MPDPVVEIVDGDKEHVGLRRDGGAQGAELGRKQERQEDNEFFHGVIVGVKSRSDAHSSARFVALPFSFGALPAVSP